METIEGFYEYPIDRIIFLKSSMKYDQENLFGKLKLKRRLIYKKIYKN